MRYLAGLVMLVAMAVAAQNPLDDAFAGKFADANLTAEFIPSNGGYTGTIKFGAQTFPATAQRTAAGIEGEFVSGANKFPFSATINNGQCTLVSGTKTFSLRRVEDNPLDSGGSNGGGNAGENPPDNGGNSAGNNGANIGATVTAPAGYAVVNATAYGQAMAGQKPNVNSLQAALQITMGDLSRVFDARASVLSAYQDTRDQRSGGASFAAKLKGEVVKGWISCRVVDQGAVVVVVYCKANAPAAEWNKLLSTPANNHAAPEIKLREYKFPDNTGSVGIAEGWATDAQSMMSPVIIKGPQGQTVTLGLCLSVVTPNSMAVQTQLQLEANARQNGFPPPPRMQMLVAPFSDPTTALNNLMPQLDRMTQQNAGKSIRLDNLKQIKEVPPYLQGARAALATYGITEMSQQGQKHTKCLARLEVTPISNDSFMLTCSALEAPDAIFEQNLPVMIAMYSSLRENAGVIQEKTKENIDAANARFKAQQDAHRELMATYDSYNRSWEKNQNIQSRSIDNFDEVIRGYRTVQDTTTGEKTQVDLGHVDQIVDRLNESDPGRYVQIPLRDEADPLPQGR